MGNSLGEGQPKKAAVPFHNGTPLAMVGVGLESTVLREIGHQRKTRAIGSHLSVGL